MKFKYRLKRGLSLMETLIALLCLGFISIVTIGIVGHEVAMKQMNALKVAFNNEISIAAADMQANNELAGYSNTEEFMDKFKEYFKSETLSDEEVNNYFATQYKSEDGEDILETTALKDKDGNDIGGSSLLPSGGDVVRAVSSKGISFAISYNKTCNPKHQFSQNASTSENGKYGYDYIAKNEALSCIEGYYDVNGPKGPNKVGVDVRKFTTFPKNCKDAKFIPDAYGKCPEDFEGLGTIKKQKFCANTDLTCKGGDPTSGKTLDRRSCDCVCRISCPGSNEPPTKDCKCQCNIPKLANELGWKTDGSGRFKSADKKYSSNDFYDFETSQTLCTSICQPGKANTCRKNGGKWNDKTCHCDCSEVRAKIEKEYNHLADAFDENLCEIEARYKNETEVKNGKTFDQQIVENARVADAKNGTSPAKDQIAASAYPSKDIKDMFFNCSDIVANVSSTSRSYTRHTGSDSSADYYTTYKETTTHTTYYTGIKHADRGFCIVGQAKNGETKNTSPACSFTEEQAKQCVEKNCTVEEKYYGKKFYDKEETVYGRLYTPGWHWGYHMRKYFDLRSKGITEHSKKVVKTVKPEKDNINCGKPIIPWNWMMNRAAQPKQCVVETKGKEYIVEVQQISYNCKKECECEQSPMLDAKSTTYTVTTVDTVVTGSYSIAKPQPSNDPLVLNIGNNPNAEPRTKTDKDGRVLFPFKMEYSSTADEVNGIKQGYNQTDIYWHDENDFALIVNGRFKNDKSNDIKEYHIGNMLGNVYSTTYGHYCANSPYTSSYCEQSGEYSTGFHVLKHIYDTDADGLVSREELLSAPDDKKLYIYKAFTNNFEPYFKPLTDYVFDINTSFTRNSNATGEAILDGSTRYDIQSYYRRMFPVQMKLKNIAETFKECKQNKICLIYKGYNMKTADNGTKQRHYREEIWQPYNGDSNVRYIFYPTGKLPDKIKIYSNDDWVIRPKDATDETQDSKLDPSDYDKLVFYYQENGKWYEIKKYSTYDIIYISRNADVLN